MFPDLKGFDRIKFGPGVIGRLTTLVGICIFLLAGLAAIVDVTEFRIGMAASIVGLVVIFLIMAFRYADKNQSTSILEGAHAVRFHKQEMAAKGFDIEALPAEVREISTPDMKSIGAPKNV